MRETVVVIQYLQNQSLCVIYRFKDCKCNRINLIPTYFNSSVCVAQYRCPEDGQCVDYDKVCDKHPDCPEATDEMNCTDGNTHTHT